MMNGELRIKNTINMSKEDAIGQPVEMILKDNNPIPLGIITHADEDYLCIGFEHNNNEDVIIETNEDVWVLELNEEK